jgi:prepilin-type N-terminal cleavage/methylation domain-containing protein
MRTGEQIKRRGFTLVETVVTIGIIAALAAVVYPTVVKQLDSADPTRLAEDLGNIRTGLETFGVNVRPQLPHDIEDLVNRPDLTTDSTSLDAFYSSSEAAGWNGPYIGISIPVTTVSGDTVVTTGYGARIVNRLAAYDLAAVSFVGGDSVPAGGAAAADFVAVRIVGLSGAAFNSANLLIDGPTENDATKRRSTGRLRCPAVVYSDGAACANAYYLAVPSR